MHAADDVVDLNSPVAWLLVFEKVFKMLISYKVQVPSQNLHLMHHEMEHDVDVVNGLHFPPEEF